MFALRGLATESEIVSVPGLCLWHTVAVEVQSIFIFLLVILFGSYVQAVAGFAMGMIIVAVVGGMRLLDIPTLAAVVSLMTIVNTTFSLRGQLGFVHRRLLFWIGVGQLPGIFLGFWLMGYLDAVDSRRLELCLGIFITVGGLAMAIRPRPLVEVSSGFFAWTCGLLGGLLGGMFSASGPVLGWFGYSQPLALNVIRATLLSSFFMTTSTRTVLVGFQGGLTETVLTYAALGIPAVILGAWLGKTFPPLLREDKLKRGAFFILLLMGIWICFSALQPVR